MGAELRYRCPGCRGLHIEKSVAKKCCEPFTREVFICLICEGEHTLRVEAEICCTGLQTVDPSQVPAELTQ